MSRIKSGDREQVLHLTRQRLLEAAAAAFARSGYENANINDISLAAGLAKGTVYNYFPSKRDLLLTLVSDTAVLHYDFITRQVSQETDPVSRLERFFESGFSFVADNLPRMRVMVHIIYGADAEMKDFIFNQYQPLFTFVGQEVVAYGVAAGRFRPVDPVAMGQLLLTIYLGTASHVSDTGFFFLKPEQVADFARNALLVNKALAPGQA